MRGRDVRLSVVSIAGAAVLAAACGLDQTQPQTQEAPVETDIVEPGSDGANGEDPDVPQAPEPPVETGQPDEVADEEASSTEQDGGRSPFDDVSFRRSHTFDVTHHQGYEYTSTVTFALADPTIDITDAPPGYADLYVRGVIEVRVTNRTEGRNAPFRYPVVLVYFPERVVWLVPARLGAAGYPLEYTLSPGARGTLDPVTNQVYHLGQVEEAEAEAIVSAIQNEELSGYEIGFTGSDLFDVFANDGTLLGTSRRGGAAMLDSLGTRTQPFMLECVYERGTGVGLRYCPPQVEGL